MTTTEMFNFAAALANAAHGLRLAVVRNATDKDITFGENVATNRGAVVRSFDTAEEAQQWLEAEDTTPDAPDTGAAEGGSPQP